MMPVFESFALSLLDRSIKRKLTGGMAVCWISPLITPQRLINGFIRQHGRGVIPGKLCSVTRTGLCFLLDIIKSIVPGVIGCGWMLWDGMSRLRGWPSHWERAGFPFRSEK